MYTLIINLLLIIDLQVKQQTEFHDMIIMWLHFSAFGVI